MSGSQVDVRVGQMVQWFVAEKSEAAFAAVVLEVNPGGMLTLLSWDTSGFATRRGNVWPRGSKSLSDSPALGVRFGCWAPVFPEENPAEATALTESTQRKPLPKKNLEPVA